MKEMKVQLELKENMLKANKDLEEFEGQKKKVIKQKLHNLELELLKSQETRDKGVKEQVSNSYFVWKMELKKNKK